MTLYNGQVEEQGNVWIIRIRKPIYGTVVSIREKILKDAQRKGKTLRVVCPGATEDVSPNIWMREGTKISKVFLRPDQPMILYQRMVKGGEEK